MKANSVRSFDGQYAPEAYLKKIEQASGRWWFERYPKWAAPYAQMTVDRNNEALQAAGSGERILDIGCGLGDVLYLSRNSFAHRAGVDAVAEMVEASRGNLQECGLADTSDLQVATADCLPFPDQHFDAVTLLDVYEHIDPLQRAASLREICRVLKADGRLVLATPSRSVLRFWQVIDGLFCAPIHLLRGREVRIWHFQNKPFTERFCSRSELLADLQSCGLKVESVRRVSFYPAPETTGFFGMCLRAASRWPVLHQLLCRFSRCLSMVTVLRQKLLVCCSIDPSDGIADIDQVQQQCKAA